METFGERMCSGDMIRRISTHSGCENTNTCSWGHQVEIEVLAGPGSRDVALLIVKAQGGLERRGSACTKNELRTNEGTGE